MDFRVNPLLGSSHTAQGPTAARVAGRDTADARDGTALIAPCCTSPPLHSEGDPLWAVTLEAVTSILGEATPRGAAGDVPAGHGTLAALREALGEALGDLHARNRGATVSDRRNAYHAEVVVVLGLDLTTMDTAIRHTLLKQAAVLAHLATDILSAPRTLRH